MAAPAFYDHGESTSQLAFDGSSEEEILDAKLFWESLLLIPPHESRLVSEDVNQRLKIAAESRVAPPVQTEEQLAATAAFLRKVQERNRQDQQAVTEHFIEKKKETVTLFRKQQNENLMKEARVSKPVIEGNVLSNMEEPRCASPDYLADLDDNAQELVLQLNNNYGRSRHDSDSD